MTPSDFSVLLLAWDDADPSVAVFGGAALPPTLPLVYHLAAAQPVLAVFPHLPEETATNPIPEFATESNIPGFSSQGSTNSSNTHAAPETAATDAAGVTAETATAAEVELQEATEVATPEAAPTRDTAGIRRLTVAASGAAPAFTSVLVGLEDQAAAASPAEPEAAGPAPNTPAAPAAPAAPANAPARSQWPTGAHAPQHLSWAAPAAPYLGASVPAGPPVLLPVPPLVAAPTVREAADLAQAALSWPAGFSPLAAPVAAQLLAASSVAGAIGNAKAAQETEAAGDENAPAAAATEATEAAEQEATKAAVETNEPDEAPFTGLRPAVFEETVEEVGAAEANDLSAPEDDLTPDAPETPAPVAEADAIAPTIPPLLPEPQPTPALTARTPPLDGLNSRMIQYARQAAQMVQGRSDFGVIYAPSWPAWLAALEIRNSSRRPLVLYAASLAADFARPAERGWLLEVERMTLRRAHLILVPTEAVRQQVRAAYGTDTGEVRVMPADDEAAVQAVLRELAAS